MQSGLKTLKQLYTLFPAIASGYGETRKRSSSTDVSIDRGKGRDGNASRKWKRSRDSLDTNGYVLALFQSLTGLVALYMLFPVSVSTFPQH